MKPSTNFKVIIGIFLLIFCALAFYLMAKDFTKQSNQGGLYDTNSVEKKILEQ